MKIGFVVECSLEGPEHKLAKTLVSVFCPKDEAVVSPMGNKGRLLKAADAEVTKLLDRGCSRVFVIWDWHPLEARWGKAPPKRWKPGVCRVEVHELRKSLDANGISKSKVVLTCVAQELEAWALADHNAIAAVIGRRRRQAVEGVQKTNRPESCPDPETMLEAIFLKYGVALAKHSDVPAIFEAAKATRFRRLKSCPSFVRLIEKLTGKSFEKAIAG